MTLLTSLLFTWLAVFGEVTVELPSAEEQIQESSDTGDTIVLLQGMGRGCASLWVLDTRLQSAGYRTLNFPYVAHSRSIEEMALQFLEFLRERVEQFPYHIVAHSLGTLIARAAFEQELPPGLGRVVLIAPPNEPTGLLRLLKENPVYQWFTGSSGQQVASDEFYENLPPPPVEFAIIAGDRGQEFTLTEPNDGVITVASTRLPGMADWIVMPHAHNFLANSRRVAALCVSFLEKGSFNREEVSEERAAGEQPREYREEPSP
ncbi:MAG: alpha/beta hydrolase [Candidatus Hydrogenedens sp.]|jgi:pimeloyl-ACP methyl ester carboxylesterase|nr:alpha/beta hydrolase [Candidatus Hydrogenedens sp.]